MAGIGCYFLGDFKYGPSKPEIILDLNPGLVNILLKGRSVSMPSGMDMASMTKMTCNKIINDILENGNDNYSSSGGSCTIDEGYGSMTLSGCDCSDPKNYKFYDAGRF